MGEDGPKEKSESSHYAVLGLRDFSDAAAVKQRFRTLARSFHPDKGGSNDGFSQIQTAYEVLSNPDAKRAYDEVLKLKERRVPASFLVPLDVEDFEESVSGFLVAKCRCGGRFEIPVSSLSGLTGGSRPWAMNTKLKTFLANYGMME
jgi:curved DNA-binding protein CbpA